MARLHSFDLNDWVRVENHPMIPDGSIGAICLHPNSGDVCIAGFYCVAVTDPLFMRPGYSAHTAGSYTGNCYNVRGSFLERVGISIKCPACSLGTMRTFDGDYMCQSCRKITDAA